MTGTILGNRYELLEKIGEGGMAEVYKAKCHLLNRYVAVKILKNQYSDNIEFVKKFKQEAASAASLSHNNIVSIYDIGSENNINYIVMEYIDGKTLKQVINEQGILNCNQAILIAIQIAEALECAHNNNIIHRDVKPHNILVTKQGIIKVTDFGIAKATSSVTITNSDRIIGSAHYFSPEQAKGNFVDCKTDIYSLGIILYEMVTGTLPFDGDSPVSIALKHIQEKVKPPIEVNPSIPMSINNLILKAIEKEPYNRYQNTQELLVDLQKIKKDPNVNIITSNKEDEYTKIMKPIAKANYDKVSNTSDIEDTNNIKKLDNLKTEIDKEDDEDLDDDEYEGGRIKNKKMIVISLAVIAVIIIGFASAYSIFGKKFGPNKAGKKVMVPSIIGLKQEEAKKIVEEQGLKFVPSTESSDKPAGLVIKCYPFPGTEIDTSKQDEVRAIISSGPKVSKIPNLIDIEFDAAKEYLKMYNLELGNVSSAFSNTVDKGKVCDQSPKPNSLIDENTVVDLVISKGVQQKMTRIPKLINKNLDEAQEVINNSKLKLGALTKVKTDNSSLDGIVFAQSIEPNKEVKENTTINLSYYIYSDKILITVPDFVNKTVREARILASRHNLVIRVNGKDDFIITHQDKASGREVEEGTVINLKSEPNP